MRRVVLFKERTALGKLINVRGRLVVIAVAAHMVGAQAINAEQDKVRFLVGIASSRGRVRL